jgi:hypothetical protein
MPPAPEGNSAGTAKRPESMTLLPAKALTEQIGPK